jgi:hypothetical protein
MKMVPLDIVDIVRDRALSSADPTDDGIRFHSENRRRGRSDLEMSAMNTARGSLAEALGDLLTYNSDGSRTASVVPVLSRLASDPALAVRASVAHVVAAALRHARPEAIAAFELLIAADDILLATNSVQRLINYIGNNDSSLVMPTVDRMLESGDAEVRESGGHVAAFAALEWGVPGALARAMADEDHLARVGAARMCAYRLPRTSNVDVAAKVLTVSMADAQEDVRKAAAEMAGSLRGHRLRPFANVVSALIGSPSFVEALPQLLITLERAPDKMQDFALLCSKRFIEVHGLDAADIRRGAAGDARQIGRLIIRGLSQSRRREERTEFLDILDELLRIGAYGFDDMIKESER